MAGHGVMNGQLYYFIPHDMEKAGTIDQDLRNQALSADALADAKALKRVMVLDTCAAEGR